MIYSPDGGYARAEQLSVHSGPGADGACQELLQLDVQDELVPMLPGRCMRLPQSSGCFHELFNLRRGHQRHEELLPVPVLLAEMNR